MRYEWKKNRKLVRNSFILTLLAALGIACTLFFTYAETLTTKQSDRMVYGPSGLKVYTRYVHKHAAGIFDEKSIDAFLKLFQKERARVGIKKAALICNQKYPEYGVLIAGICSDSIYDDVEELGDFDFSNIPSAKNFDQRVEAAINGISQGNVYSNAELKYKSVLAKRMGQIWKKGIYFDATDHWVLYKRAKIFFCTYMTMMGILVGSILYSQDKRNQMNRILSTLGNEAIDHISVNKFIFCAVLVSLEYFLGLSVMTLFFLLPFGSYGWKSPIQIVGSMYKLSVYSWTNSHFFLLTAAGDLLLILTIMFLSCLIAILTDNLYASLFISFTLTLLPYVCISLFSESQTLMHLISIHPFMNLNDDYYLTIYFSYGIGRFRILSFYASIIIGAVLILMAGMISPGFYRSRLKNHVR